MLNPTELILTALISFGICSMAHAQNSVNVSQNGSGNKVTINQSGSEAGKKPDCSEAQIEKKGANNAIVVTANDGSEKTLLRANNAKHINIAAILLGTYKLDASQKGSSNGLYLALPDSSNELNKISTHQKGSSNTIAARMNPSAGNITVSQNGENNSVSIHPCDEEK